MSHLRLKRKIKCFHVYCTFYVQNACLINHHTIFMIYKCFYLHFADRDTALQFWGHMQTLYEILQAAQELCLLISAALSPFATGSCLACWTTTPGVPVYLEQLQCRHWLHMWQGGGITRELSHTSPQEPSSSTFILIIIMCSRIDIIQVESKTAREGVRKKRKIFNFSC